jgi:hypothetical protein
MSRIVITVSRIIFFRLLAHAPEELQREAKEDARRAIPALCFTEDDIREKFAQEEQWDMTGDEHIDTKIRIEKSILPRMREHDIRYVQVARAGHLESDGIVVLDDTREPRTVYLDGAYKLSDELRATAATNQERCSYEQHHSHCACLH